MTDQPICNLFGTFRQTQGLSAAAIVHAGAAVALSLTLGALRSTANDGGRGGAEGREMARADAPGAAPGPAARGSAALHAVPGNRADGDRAAPRPCGAPEIPDSPPGRTNADENESELLWECLRGWMALTFQPYRLTCIELERMESRGSM